MSVYYEWDPDEEEYTELGELMRIRYLMERTVERLDEAREFRLAVVVFAAVTAVIAGAHSMIAWLVSLDWAMSLDRVISLISRGYL